MRKLALLSIAAFSMTIAAPVFTPAAAQGSNAGPQPGLPPGASVGAPNAQPPMSTGTLSTSPTGGTSTTMETSPPHRARRAVHHTRHHHHTVRHTAPETSAQ